MTHAELSQAKALAWALDRVFDHSSKREEVPDMPEELATVVQRIKAMEQDDLHMPEAVEDLFAWRWTSLLRGFPALLDDDRAWGLG